MAVEINAVIQDVISRLRGERERLAEELASVDGALQALETGPTPAAAPPKPGALLPPTAPKKKRGAPGKPTVTDEQIRDYIRQVGTFTRKQMAEHFGLSDSWPDTRLKPFFDKGTIRMKRRAQGRGQADIIEYAPVAPSAPGAIRQPVEPPLAAGPPRERSGGPVPGTGQMRTGDKDTRPLLNVARSQGFLVSQAGGHITVRNPLDGRQTKVSSSPSDRNAAKQVQRDLENIGVRF